MSDSETSVARIECPVALPVVNEMTAKYALLTIEGLNDKDGFVAVDSARKDVKRVRLLVENWRKEQNEDALAHQRRVNAAAKLIREPLESLEDSLAEKTKAVTDEVERLKREADEKAKRETAAKLKTRMDALAGLRYYDTPDIVAAMSDETFAEFLELKKKSHQETLEAEKAEQQRQAEERAKQAEESKRLAEERAKLDAERAELEKAKQEQARIAAEAQKKIADEAARLAREEADRQAKIEAERLAVERAECERIEAEARAKREAEEVARMEALRPIHERLKDFAKNVSNTVIPKGIGDYAPQVRRIMDNAADQIVKLTH